MVEIAVVIPVRDRAHLVGAALDSVFAQTCAPAQVIVVDDGSTDGTRDALAQYDRRIEVLTSASAGPAGARNVGLDAVRCPMVAFLDSDDLWLPRALETLAALLDRDEADLAWGHTRTEILPGGARPNPAWPTEPSQLVLIPSMLFSTEALRRIGGFAAGLRFGEDSELLMRVRHHQLRVACMTETVMIHRRHADNMTRDRAAAARAWFDVARTAIRRRAAA